MEKPIARNYKIYINASNSDNYRVRGLVTFSDTLETIKFTVFLSSKVCSAKVRTYSKVRDLWIIRSTKGAISGYSNAQEIRDKIVVEVCTYLNIYLNIIEV